MSCSFFNNGRLAIADLPAQLQIPFLLINDSSY